jgi:acetyl-CoA carboxylase carboxyl transferase subunit alpha
LPSTPLPNWSPSWTSVLAPAPQRWTMPDTLDFEQPLLELETRIAELQALDDPAQREEIGKLEDRLQRLRQKVFSSLTPWQTTQLARHPRRPHTRDFCKLLFEDFIELHGDRLYGDDPAIVAGLARFEDQSVVVIGHQKGRETREKISRNFGMPHPEGYRKALRLMQLADKFRKPIITFIDTPGAYPGIGAEERGQAEAIARNLREMAALRVPVVAVVTGEGGSGGALAIGVGNRVLMLRYAVYSVISPEGCAAILWGDAAKAAEAAEIMKITATDLQTLRVIDEIVPEPAGGAHRDWDATALNLKSVLGDHLRALRGKTEDALVNERHERFRRIGAFEEEFRPSS